MRRLIWFVLSILVVLVILVMYYLNEANPGLLNIINNNMKLLLNYIFIFMILSIIFLVIRENKNPFNTLAWIQVLIFLPVIGFILYIFLGINYRKNKMFKRKSVLDDDKIEIYLKKILNTTQDNIIERQLTDNNALRLIHLLYNNNKASLVNKNKIAIFSSGKDKINSLFDDILNAKEHIHLEYFSIHNDETGKKLREILIQKAKEGVKVRLIYDAVGTWRIKKRFWKELVNFGAEVYSFLPVYFPFLNSKLNYRDHRKCAVIDGKIAYIGGVNIGNQYMGLSKKFGHWRDTHLKICGDSVLLLQKMFLLDWSFVSGQFLVDEHLFPKPEVKDLCPVQIVSSGPDSDWENIMQAYFAIIANAEDYIYIESPYMVLNESMLTSLKTAALSGVDVRIILPFKADHKIVGYGTHSYYEELLESGVKIYEYLDGFIHSKVFLADDFIVSVGSANMDIRSFKQNFELNALVYDKSFALEMKNIILSDLKNSKCIKLEEYKDRNIFKKILESLARLFSPLL
ncbi:MAG: cardiolipin synthase [Candidatus Cloacimonetes bacterium]|nr:cardiolipin synthase [Candidatus Cloacimonadota bacterium]MDD4156028.1 cardiolipin synthase [Candidatus Cloacimonadota bacterium]